MDFLHFDSMNDYTCGYSDNETRKCCAVENSNDRDDDDDDDDNRAKQQM